MNQLERYLAITILRTTLLVLLVFVSVQLLVSLLHELHSVSIGEYHIWSAIKVVLLELPGQLYQLFPIASLLGSLLGLGLLAAHSELIVMQAAGFSRLNILFALLKISVLMILVVTVLGEVVAPGADDRARHDKAIALSSGQAINTVHGLWLRDDHTFIHIEQVLPDESLAGVTLYQFDDSSRLLFARAARSARYRELSWVLYDVVQTTFLPQQTQIMHAKSMPWMTTVKPNLLGLNRTRPSDMSLLKLHGYLRRYRHVNGLLEGSFAFTFWQRVLQPGVTLVMILLAVPFVFGSLRKASMGLRLFVGICLGFSFFLVNQVVGPVSLVYQVPPLLAASMPMLLFAALGMLLFWRHVR